tara:strand:- start:372089 stop:372628 length:540 start_codon:yes stop_codon:yes gene_type:complete
MILASTGTRQGHARGFTLIELLVVIAIIGILSSVVLASLNTARNKGADTAVKSNLAGARAQAELFYDANGNAYVVTAGTATDVCNAAGNVNGVRGIATAVLSAGQAYSASMASINSTLTVAGTYNTATCHASTGGSGAWAAEAPLKASASGAPKMFCVDSSGNSKETTANLGSSDTVCP